jgi:arylsulfatase A-like enzyme
MLLAYHCKEYKLSTIMGRGYERSIQAHYLAMWGDRVLMGRNIIEHCISRARYSSLVGAYLGYKKYLCILLIAFSVVACGGGSGSDSNSVPEQKIPVSDVTEANEKPNILVMMVDDLGYNDLAINNDNTDIDTPNMDQIARDGVRFTRHYAAAVCSPARASFLTGLYPERVGYLPNGRGISPGIVTLPERLREAGYTTWHIGKWHIGVLERTAWPDHQGFDHWFGFLNQWRLAGVHENGELQFARPRYNDPWLEGDSEPGKNYTGHLENIQTDKAIAVLSELNAAQAPWFLNLWFYAPHTPVQPASEFATLYPDTDAGRYQALVNQLDTNIGRVVSHLESLGELENTIIVVVSDNGGTSSSVDSNAPYAGHKPSVTEGGLRTPLIIRWSDETLNHQVFSDIISIEDLYPTLLASIGVAPPANLDGNSFYNSIAQLEPSPRKARFWELGAQSYGALSADGRWRLHQPPPYFGITLAPKLYDLELDPTATQYLVPTPAAELAQITASYEVWYRDVHTVETHYVPDENGSGVLTGMDFLRTPGFGGYTLGIGIPDVLYGQIVAQAGVWEMSRAGNTVMAQFGDVILSGDIQDARNCHSVVVTGFFSRYISASSSPDNIRLSLFIDGIETQSVEVAKALATPDPTIETIVGDPSNPAQSSTLLPPVIMNTELTAATPWTLAAFSQELCNAPV